MANKTQTIRIESILGGQTQVSHFASDGQFLTSIGINPSLGITDPVVNEVAHFSELSCGLLRPTASRLIGSTNGAPKWIINSPRDTRWWVYDSVGSIYTMTGTLGAVSGNRDLNDAGGASGNGAAYYDNYIYFARNTTVARYGPLNGSKAWIDDYWVGTLGKTALGNTGYPLSRAGIRYPNHILHRHSDGKLYILDVVGNQGTIHYIQTTKTTVEGDTGTGSKYDAVRVGYGLYPTAIETYGSQLCIAFVEGEESDYDLTNRTTKAKVGFWDTTSQNIEQIAWVEYPDAFISSIKNVNGILYFTSGSADAEESFRTTRYVGGNTFEEVFMQEAGGPPAHGAVDGHSMRLLFGSATATPDVDIVGSVFSFGLQKASLGQGIFNVHCVSDARTTSQTEVTAIAINHSDQLARQTPIVGWASYDGIYGVDEQSWTPTYGGVASEWYSQIFRIGSPFKITKIRIPLAQPLTSGMTVIPSIRVDGYKVDNETILTSITSANFGTTKRSIVIRPQNLTGDNEFLLKLKWTGTTLCVVGLPITIEYELIDIDTAKP